MNADGDEAVGIFLEHQLHAHHAARTPSAPQTGVLFAHHAALEDGILDEEVGLCLVVLCVGVRLSVHLAYPYPQMVRARSGCRHTYLEGVRLVDGHFALEGYRLCLVVVGLIAERVGRYVVAADVAHGASIGCFCRLVVGSFAADASHEHFVQR